MPDPVGAMTRVWSPSAIAFQAWDWAGVGATNVPVNHSRVSALKRSSGSSVRATPSMVPTPTDKYRQVPATVGNHW